jgi:hypothetical protein
MASSWSAPQLQQAASGETKRRLDDAAWLKGSRRALEQGHVAVNSILRDCGQNAQHSTNQDRRAWGAK